MPPGPTPPVCAPTATRIPASAAGAVLICGSHGGAYAGYLAALAGPRAVVLNDAGGGLDRAGIAALDLGDSMGLAVATVAHDTARIGDAEDMLGRGRISHVNAAARATGCEPGMACAEAAALLARARPPAGPPPAYEEAREVLGTTAAGLRIVCVDSISLVREEDVGQVVMSGSHGGVVSGQRTLAIKVRAAAAFYNDAGVGIEDAGLARLAVLDEQGIPAGTVDAATARIGDGRSTYRDGRLSRINAAGATLGIRTGMSAREAAERIPAPPTR